MHGSASRKFVLVPALVAVFLLALAPVASAKEDPHAPPTTAAGAPSTTIAEAGPPPSTAAGDPGDPAGSKLEAATTPPTTTPRTTAPPDPPPPAEPGPVALAVAADRRVSVSPDSGLAHLQEVQISGSGYEANESVGISQCRADATDVFGDCDIGRTAIPSTDADGNFTSSLRVSARIRLSNSGAVVDCTTEFGDCTIGVIRLANFGDMVTVPIGFNPDAVPPPPVVTVTPSSGLAHDQQVAISGSGFAPNTSIQVQECAVADEVIPVCANRFGGTVIFVDANGNMSTTLVVKRIIGSADFRVVDCLDDPGCAIRVLSYDDPLADANVPISFDPDAPLPPRPVITISPDSDLVHNQEVRVTGSGFPPDTGVNLRECVVGGDPYAGCIFVANVFVFADQNGDIDAKVVVRRIMGSFGATTDCLDPPGCVIRASSFTDDPLASVEALIGFDPDAPLPPSPVLTIDPSNNLVHDELVTVTGTGFTANSPVNLTECTESNDGQGFCSYFGFGLLMTDGSGTFSTTFVVKRVLGYFGGPIIDCLDVGCALYARVSDDPVLGTAELGLQFDPDAPLPPPPRLSVTPSTDLPARQQVDVQGSGFTPDAFHNVVQCATDGTDVFALGDPCIYGPSVQADENGDIDAQFTARRYIQSFFEPIDCAQTGRCTISVFSYDEPLSHATVPVKFDPDAPPPPQPTLTVTPADGLADGTTVTVTGKDFSPGAIVAMSECRGVGTTGLFCDTSIIKFVTADENGGFSTDYKVLSNIQVADGPVACEAAPGACSIQALNVGDLAEITSTVLLTFGAKVADPLIGVGGGGATTPVKVTPAPRLAFTGTPVAGYLEFAAISLGLGVLLLVAGRKRGVRA